MATMQAKQCNRTDEVSHDGVSDYRRGFLDVVLRRGDDRPERAGAVSAVRPQSLPGGDLRVRQNKNPAFRRVLSISILDHIYLMRTYFVTEIEISDLFLAVELSIALTITV